VLELAPAREQLVVVLDRTAFYPTSGGQLFDTGRLLANGQRVNVIDVQEREDDGAVLHYLAPPEAATAPSPAVPDAAPLIEALAPGSTVRGEIDAARRRDHMQQHTGQHVFSAAFVRLFAFNTVSFHMGAESCTIDLDTPEVTRAQLEQVEQLANEVIWEDRPVGIRFVLLDEARSLGLRKLPERSGDIRLIDVNDFDLCACGGTHVRHTGQIGAIQVRRTEKVRQGTRVEFVCGLRAVTTARRDFQTLTDSAAQFSAHIYEVPQQIRKVLDDVKAGQKREQLLLQELAAADAGSRLAAAEDIGGVSFLMADFADRDAAYIKLLAQKAVATSRAAVLLTSKAGQPAIVIAQTTGLPLNCGVLLKVVLQEVGGRGGGAADFAQGGAPDAASLQRAANSLAEKIRKALAG